VALEISILGPVVALLDEDAVDLGPPQQRALLALLSARASSVVPVDTIVDALWPEEPPVSAAKVVQTYVWRLRKTLGAETIVRRGRGYALNEAETNVDAIRFEQLVQDGRLAEALALWRGPALADVVGPPALRQEAVRLEERRMRVLEHRIDDEIAAGNHADVVADLRALVAEHPLRERLIGQLMTALYLSGRQAEALDVYRSARRRLVDELGIEPGPALKELERRILEQDERLGGPPLARKPQRRAGAVSAESGEASVLPVTASPFFGRTAELRRLLALLRGGGRIVTVTGSGGTGKTRLAVEAAAVVEQEFPNGVWWVSLAGVPEVELVLPAIASAVGARRHLRDALRDKHGLLVIDNFEHVLDAAGALAELLHAIPRVQLLVTSRAPLRIADEQELPLAPLGDDDAIALFVDRARAVGRELAAGPTVAEICRRLDGLPLALELAAGRLRLLEPEALLARLERRLPLLSGGRRDAPERQRTLRAAIAWSHDLLDAEQRQLFSRVSVFAGPFTVAAAEEVCDADLDALEALVEASLLERVADDGAAESADATPATVAAHGRLRMLETIREFAAEQLEASGEAYAFRRRHAEHFCRFGEIAEAEVRVARPASLDAVDRDHTNVQAALAWTVEQHASDLAARLVGAFAPFWHVRGQMIEGRAWTERVLDLVEVDSVSPELEARVLRALTMFQSAQGDFEGWKSSSARRLEIARALRDDAELARCLTNLGLIAFVERQLEQAATLFESALAAFAEAGEAAHGPIAHLGRVRALQGDFDGAETLLGRSLEAARERRDLEQIITITASLARLSLLRDSADESVTRIRDVLRMAEPIGYKDEIAGCALTLAAALARKGKLRRAAELFGKGEQLQEELGAPPHYDEFSPQYGDAATYVRDSLGEEEWLAAVAAGRRQDLAEILDLALREATA
jgi:predicted ATPase/DNA-binding SARP family transcriptional activator